MSYTNQPISGHTLSSGMVLHDNYIIDRILGEGGFGITYSGTCIATKEQVAIKEYFPSGVATRIHKDGHRQVSHFDGKLANSFQKGMSRFLNEANLLKEFHSLGSIVSVFDVFEENGTAYIVMEYIEGITLKELITNEGSLSFDEMLTLLKPVLLDLHEVHKKGLIHRDISPDNLIVGMDNKLHLIDFGAASFENPNESKTMTVILKSGYAPPEQYISDGRIGAWTDVYALCATMYMVLNGEKPIDSIHRMQKDTLELKGNCNSLTDYQKDAITQGLRLNYAERFSSVKLLYQALTTPPKGDLTKTMESAEVSKLMRKQLKERFQTNKDDGASKQSFWTQYRIVLFVIVLLCTITFGLYGASKSNNLENIFTNQNNSKDSTRDFSQEEDMATTDESNKILLRHVALVGYTEYASFIPNGKDVYNSLEGLTWKSSNPEIATIDEHTGEVTFVGTGQVSIHATYEGVTYSSSVTVGSTNPDDYPISLDCSIEGMVMTIGGKYSYENPLLIDYTISGYYPDTVSYETFTNPNFLPIVGNQTNIRNGAFSIGVYPYEEVGEGTLSTILWDTETGEILAVHTIPVTVHPANTSSIETSLDNQSTLLTMIDVTGMTKDNAELALQKLDSSITVNITEEYSSDVLAGLVISQSISENTQFTQGQINQIHLVVSKGAKPITQSSGNSSTQSNTSNNGSKTNTTKSEYTTIHLD